MNNQFDELTKHMAQSVTRRAALKKSGLVLTGIVLTCLGLLFTGIVRAQSYSINWFTIDGGGGTSTGGMYSVSGTIGQADAGAQMTGGNFALTGGFWAIYAQQTLGAPLLSIKLTDQMAMVYWPSPSAGYHLQVSTNLATVNWTTPAETVSDDGTIKYILVNPPTGNRYYRLVSP
ncbi:MAG TPA: hypothetical protein VMB80_05995 [Candidatus Acidoferrum sp.]|nr:hypothetical protein [Candidatus Acidoferrum sp.]